MTPDKFSLSFFKGEASLHNLELKESFLQVRRAADVERQIQSRYEYKRGYKSSG